jgi:hypothetical protein
MTKSNLLIVFLFALTLTAIGQGRTCGVEEQELIRSLAIEGYNEYILKCEEDLQNRLTVNWAQKTNLFAGIVKIPVVFHVIGDDVLNDFDLQRFHDQLRILNEDFRKKTGTNGDGNGQDAQIEFCYASKDPDGNPTSGIVTYSDDPNNPYPSYWEDNTDYSKPLKLKQEYRLKENQWNPQIYLNIWVINDMNRLAFSSFPTTLQILPELDGVVICYKYVGLSGDANYGYGRTLTHEVGHWLNLNHTWGNGNGDCSVDDGVDDTPVCSQKWFSLYDDGCPSIFQCATQNSIAGLTSQRQIENYMDYSDDLCMNMFTLGQVNRMHDALSYYRSHIVYNGNYYTDCSTPHCTNGVLDADELGIDCGGIDCPPCQTSGGANFPYCEYSNLARDGFLVNNSDFGVAAVCIDFPVVIEAVPPKPVCPSGEFNVVLERHSAMLGSNCDNLNATNPLYCTAGLFKCYCTWKKLFISITECDFELNPIGQEIGEWVSFDCKMSYTDNCSGVGTRFKLRNFDLLDNLPAGASITDGKVYKVKVATSKPGNSWDEGVRYISTYSNNVNVTNSKVSTNLYANKILLSDVQITNDIDIYAAQAIDILTSSDLLMGSYLIDPNLNCDLFQSAKMGNKELYKQKNDINQTLDSELIRNNQLAVIFPNPSSGSLNIKIDKSFLNASFQILNSIGIPILSGTLDKCDNVLNMDLFPRGIYFVRISISDYSQIEKIILN